MITMCLGIGQPLNACLRPHVPTEGETKSSARRRWEFGHKSTGYFAIFCAFLTISLGTTLVPDPTTQMMIRFIDIALILILIVIVVYLKHEKKQANSAL